MVVYCWLKLPACIPYIVPNFRGTQFSWMHGLLAENIWLLKHFVRSIKVALCHRMVRNSWNPLSRDLPLANSANWEMRHAFQLQKVERIPYMHEFHPEQKVKRAVDTYIVLQNKVPFFCCLPIHIVIVNGEISKIHWIQQQQPFWAAKIAFSMNCM